MAPPARIERVGIQAGQVQMDGALRLPDDALGVILFADGSGSSRIKPPGDYVASVLFNARLGVLWLDMQTREEAASREERADVTELARRLSAACDWLRKEPSTCDLPIGLFGASTGAAAAMQLASVAGDLISALVTRGGRPDSARYGTLGKISAPTLMIVGGLDLGVLDLNRAAYGALRCKKRFEIVPGATHLFEEAGCLEVVARLARSWFLQHARFMLT